MGVALYGAYAADVNLDSALKDAVVDCSTTSDGSEFQSPIRFEPHTTFYINSLYCSK